MYSLPTYEAPEGAVYLGAFVGADEADCLARVAGKFEIPRGMLDGVEVIDVLRQGHT